MHLAKIALLNKTGCGDEHRVPLLAVQLAGQPVGNDVVVDVGREFGLVDERSVIEEPSDLSRQITIGIHGQQLKEDDSVNLEMTR